MTMTLVLGQGLSNLQRLTLSEKNELTPSSDKSRVMSEQVLHLLKQNANDATTTFERGRAKVFSTLIGTLTPLAITAIAVFSIYQFAQTNTGVTFGNQIINTTSNLAQTIFQTMTNNSASIAVSAGGSLATAYVLTRPSVYNAIGSFFGAFLGTDLAFGFKGLYQSGYNLWYNTYNFTEREQRIKRNNEVIVGQLTILYKEMADSLKTIPANPSTHEGLSSKAISHISLNQKETVSTLQKRLPVIQAIFEKNGIPEATFDEITVTLNEAIGGILEANQA